MPHHDSTAVTAQMLIRRPISHVFDAFIDPTLTTRFWFTRSSGTLVQGERTHWYWDMFGVSAAVDVVVVETDRRIVIEWGDPPRTVVWTFESRGETRTLVQISESGFVGSDDEVLRQAVDSKGGFALVLAGLKAFMEFGVTLNLVADQHPDSLVVDARSALDDRLVSPLVSLEPIVEENLQEVLELEVAPEQATYVATNAYSLAQAYAERAIAWPRAIVASGRAVGFLMLEIDPYEEHGRPFWLWRLMIDRRHQHRGFGRAALDLAVDEVVHRGGTALYTSWVPDGDATPAGFYLAYGFVPTGEMDDGEVVARLPLEPRPAVRRRP